MTRYRVLFIPLCLPLIMLLMALIPHSIAIRWMPFASWSNMAKYFLSWPVLFLVLLSCFLIAFGDSITKYLDELNEAELSGVFKTSRQSDRTATSDTLTTDAAHKLIQLRDAEWQRTLEHERNQVAAAIDGITIKENHMQKSLAEAYLEAIQWRFKYATRYLVPATINMLRWFNDYGPISELDYIKSFETAIPEYEERQARFDALRNVEFIEEVNGLWQISVYGKAFLGVPLE